MAAKTFHLLGDLGLRKTTVKRNFEDNDRGPELDNVRELLARRTQHYTLEEIRVLSGFFCSAHDECVEENPDDFTPLEIWTAKRKIQRAEKACKALEALEDLAATDCGLPSRVNVGCLSLECDASQAIMSGGLTGSHSIHRSGEPVVKWEERVQAHWTGFLQNNGVKQASILRP